MPGREFTDEALRLQLAAFLDYRARGGGHSLVRWMEDKDFSAADRSFLEVTYMGWVNGHVLAGLAS